MIVNEEYSVMGTKMVSTDVHGASITRRADGKDGVSLFACEDYGTTGISLTADEAADVARALWRVAIDAGAGANGGAAC